MQAHRLMLPVHVPGTLTANIVVTFVIPFDCRVAHVGSCCSNADGDALLWLGVSGDTDSILTSAVIGLSGVPVEKVQSDFATTNPTGKLSKDEILVLTLDFDGAGTAADDFTSVITLLEG